MNIIKKIALAFFLTLSFVAVAPIAVAAEAVVNSNNEVASVIVHIEKGLAETQKSDFSAAVLHLKSARAASEKIQGNEVLVKEGFEHIVQGQIQAKFGDVEKTTAELNKALAIYKSIK
jgi:transcriptional regulator of aromatic amino acid metabolism